LVEDRYVEERLMRIRQCYISSAIRNNKIANTFLKCYNFKKYDNIDEPSFFFGFYNGKEDVEKIKSHKSLSILIWRGSDIFMRGHLRFISKRPYIKNIAISSFIAKDLKANSISYKKIPLVGCDVKDIKSEILGDEIYTYMPKTKKKRQLVKDIYGYKILEKIRDRCRFKINVIRDCDEFSRSEILDLYKRCFLGLRLTKHDGIANTVIELGLMGRRCIYNGKGVPNAIPWKEKDIEGILNSIGEEAKHIGSRNKKLSEDMRKYIDIGKDWIDTNYWI